ncbi:MAG: DUF1028 domain-containing protein [Candidatus Eisenbacteria bacterium]|nr:DUF1028 domain-containing protein [Candidatus Eisenbacteria bacterium]
MIRRCHFARGAARLMTVRRVLSMIVLAAVWTAMPAGSGRTLEDTGTFSIVALDRETGEVGVAVQSRVFGVGPRVAWVLGGSGAVATQALSNESFGPEGLRLMAAGLTAQETLDWLLARDEGRDNRQVGVVDAQGGVATWTGPGCSAWAGHEAGGAFTCQGNILAGEAVVADMAAAYERTRGQELARRLLAALEAAQAAGGDRRGQQSAAILIGRRHPDFPEYAKRYVDIRVEDHVQPIGELRRLYEIYEAQGLVQAHLRFADWLESDGRREAARRERERVGQVMVRALETNVRDAGMLNSLAWFAAIHEIYLEDALKAAKRAVRLEPQNTNILDTLAEVYYRLGHRERAIEVESRALQLAPEDEYLEEQLERFRRGRP